jgi:hypothetical protein
MRSLLLMTLLGYCWDTAAAKSVTDTPRVAAFCEAMNKTMGSGEVTKVDTNTMQNGGNRVVSSLLST